MVMIEIETKFRKKIKRRKNKMADYDEDEFDDAEDNEEYDDNEED